MAALATRMLWPASVTVRTFTNGGRTYTYAKILDVLAADVAAAVSAGLVYLGGASAVASISGAVPAIGVGVAGEVTVPPQVPPGGFAILPNVTSLPFPPAAGQNQLTDPNRPLASTITAGGIYIDAALQRPLISDGAAWYDVMNGNFISL